MRADQRRDRALGHQPPRRTPACAAGGGARSSRLLWLLIAPIASAKFTSVSDTDVDVLAQAELVSGHALWGVSPRFLYRVHRDVYPDLLGPSCPFHAAFLLGGSKELPPEVVEVYQRIKKPGARKPPPMATEILNSHLLVQTQTYQQHYASHLLPDDVLEALPFSMRWLAYWRGARFYCIPWPGSHGSGSAGYPTPLESGYGMKKDGQEEGHKAPFIFLDASAALALGTPRLWECVYSVGPESPRSMGASDCV